MSKADYSELIASIGSLPPEEPPDEFPIEEFIQRLSVSENKWLRDQTSNLLHKLVELATMKERKRCFEIFQACFELEVVPVDDLRAALENGNTPEEFKKAIRKYFRAPRR